MNAGYRLLGRGAALGVAGGFLGGISHSIAADGFPDVPMFASQEKLPRLPVPALEDSLRRYLQAIGPLVPASQLEATRALVAEQLIAGSVMHGLNAELISREVSQISFVSAAWDTMYLEGRYPLPINSNPGAIIRTRKVFGPEAITQVARAARIVAANVAVAQHIDAGTLASPRLNISQPLRLSNSLPVLREVTVSRSSRRPMSSRAYHLTCGSTH